MSLPATDDFAGSGALSASWTHAFSTGAGFSRVSGVARSQDSTANVVYWNADVFNDDQYSSIVVGANFPGNDVYAVARASGIDSGFQGYLFGSGGTYRLTGGGGFTQIGATGSGGVSGDTVKIEVSGTTVRGYKNGTQVGSDITDATFASGAAGIFGFNANQDIDSWEGGNLGGGGTNRRRRLLMVAR